MKQQSKTIKGWIATDRNDYSHLYDINDKIKRKKIMGWWATDWTEHDHFIRLGKNYLGQTWQDEPWKVKITISKE